MKKERYAPLRASRGNRKQSWRLVGSSEHLKLDAFYCPFFPIWPERSSRACFSLKGGARMTSGALIDRALVQSLWLLRHLNCFGFRVCRGSCEAILLHVCKDILVFYSDGDVLLRRRWIMWADGVTEQFDIPHVYMYDKRTDCFLPPDSSLTFCSFHFYTFFSEKVSLKPCIKDWTQLYWRFGVKFKCIK